MLRLPILTSGQMSWNDETVFARHLMKTTTEGVLGQSSATCLLLAASSHIPLATSCPGCHKSLTYKLCDTAGGCWRGCRSYPVVSSASRPTLSQTHRTGWSSKAGRKTLRLPFVNCEVPTMTSLQSLPRWWRRRGRRRRRGGEWRRHLPAGFSFFPSSGRNF